jgi:hypothetical protein
MKTFKINISVILALIVTGIVQVNAQEIRKEVEVVKPYEPVVSDAFKINILPKINDSVIIKPAFQYAIVPVMLKTDYQVNPINAAKMVGMPLTKLYRSYMKLGLGNTGTPLGELYINSFRSKNHTAGLYFHHQSSGGNVKLDNNKKVFAGYSETMGNIFAKWFLKNSYLYGEGGVSNNTNFQYGYNPVIDTSLVKGEIRQALLLASLNLGIRSSHSDSSKLAYDAGFSYKFMQNRFKQNQNAIILRASGVQKYKDFMVGLNTSLSVLKPNAALDSSENSNSVFTLHPFGSYATAEYSVKAGLDINFENQEDKLHFRIYPEAEVSINIARNVLVGFVGMRGQVCQHTYADIFYENPFIRPDQSVRNTYLRSSNYGGIKGSLGAAASYMLKVDFSKIKNQYFFLNDTSSVLQNQFTVVYDDLTQVNLSAELNYDFNESIGIEAEFNYFQYQMEKEAHAWHKPDFNFILSAKYNLRNKILANFDVIGVGKRFAKIPGIPDTIKELPGAVDFNFGLEYRYTKILSFWVKLNNIAGSNYNLWNFYPSQRFNFMLGITYSM